MCFNKTSVFIIILLVVGLGLNLGCSNGPTGNLNNPAPIEVQGPDIDSIYPEDDATNISLNTDIQIIFSDRMDSTTINNANFKVQDANGSRKAGDIYYDADTKTARFAPIGNYKANTEYFIIITADIKNEQGIAISQGFSSSFTTGTTVDIGGPIVLSTYPGSNATAIPYDVTISVTLNEEILFASITFEVTNTDDSLTVNGDLGYIPSQKKVIFTPEAELGFGKHYQVRFTCKDLSSNYMASYYTFNFTSKGWAVEEITGSGREGSIAVDNNDTLHVACGFYKGADRSVGYTYKPVGGSWQSLKQVMPGEGFWSVDTDIVADNDDIHINYNYGSLYTRYRYAYRDSSTWTTYEAPVGSGSLILNPSSALAIYNGKIYIAYYDRVTALIQDKCLKLAEASIASNPVFTETIIDQTSTNVGRDADIAINSSGTIYMTYFDDINDKLKIANKSQAAITWSMSNIAQGTNLGSASATAIDKNNILYITYNTNDGKLMLAKMANQAINAYEVDSGGVGNKNSIYIDDNDIIHIAYADTTNGYLKYASCEASGDLSNDWIKYSITNVAGITKTSIVADSNSKPHIAYFYYDGANSDLNHAFIE